MSKPGMSDAGVGRALFATRIRLSLQAGWMSFKFGALPGFLLPLAVWLYSVSAMNWDLVRLRVLAAIAGSDGRHLWMLRDEAGVSRPVTVYLADGNPVQWLTGDQVLHVVAQPLQAALAGFWLAVLTGVLCSAAGSFVVLSVLKRIGAASQKDQRLRGAEELLSVPELNRRVRRDGPVDYRLAQVCLPRQAPMTGILIEGAQGSGKSIAFNDLMCQVFAKKRKCVIFDHSGEYFRAYFRPGKDVFFNPALAGSVPWSIFAEMRKTYNADTLAQAFLPPKAGVATGANAFFEDAARAVFSAILLRLYEAGAVNTRDIASTILSMPADQMDFLIRNTVASSAIGGDSKTQRQGVISSIAIYLNGLASVQAGSWSVRQFFEADDDARLFLLGTAETKAMFAPLYRLIISVAFSAIAARGEVVYTDRYWFFLDEVKELGDIKLDEALATLRKFGVCIVPGWQSHSQIEEALGDKRAATITNCLNTALILRANDDRAQERAAKRLGKLEMETVGRSQALAVAEWRDGAGLNMNDKEKWLVMPSEIGAVPVCVGWVKLAGDYPATKVDYRHWTKKRFGYRRLDEFAPVQPLPPEDPSFQPHRVEDANALQSVTRAFEAQQKQKQADANTASKGQAGSGATHPGAAPTPSGAPLDISSTGGQARAAGPVRLEASPQVNPRLDVVAALAASAAKAEAEGGRAPVANPNGTADAAAPGNGGRGIQPPPGLTPGHRELGVTHLAAGSAISNPELGAELGGANAAQPTAQEQQATDLLGVQQQLQADPRQWEQHQQAPGQAQASGPQLEIER